MVDMICLGLIKLNPCVKCGYQPEDLKDSVRHDLSNCIKKQSLSPIDKSVLVSGKIPIEEQCFECKRNKSDCYCNRVGMEVY